MIKRYATHLEVAAARNAHCVGSDHEIEIDEPAEVSRGEDGVWVKAWVFVPASDIPGYQADRP